MKAHAFLILRTSPGKDGAGNYQAWVAVQDPPADAEAAEDFARRHRKAVSLTPAPAVRRVLPAASISS